LIGSRIDLDFQFWFKTNVHGFAFDEKYERTPLDAWIRQVLKYFEQKEAVIKVLSMVTLEEIMIIQTRKLKCH